MSEKLRISVKKKGRLDGLIDMLSFSREVRSLVEVLNTEIAAPEKVVFRPISHPAGFARLVTKRRLTIAEAYIKLVSLCQSPDYMSRIEALQVLVHHVWHSKNLSMPLNTARVQIALMKNAVKKRGNRRAQLELMSDFARASYGQTSVIRRLLRELDLIEVPETGENLSAMKLGWDDHVHDSMTEGRKSPSQLVLDAFIKGISRITAAYYDIASQQTYEEIFLAGKILGIRVQVGIEFSVGQKYARRHYLYVPPQGYEYGCLRRFLDENETRLAPFLQGLQENAARRHATVVDLLNVFNRTGLPKFNESYSELDALQMAPLSWESVENVTTKGQANRIHLGQLIYQTMRPVALKRVLYLKNQYRSLSNRAMHDASASWEAERCLGRFEKARREYEELTPALCAEKYIAPQKQIDYDSAFGDEDDILPRLSQCGGYIVFIHPLSQGLQKSIDILFRQYKYLTDIEVFNLVDALTRDTVEIRRFAAFLGALGDGSRDAVENVLREWRLPARPPKDIDDFIAYLREHPFYMRCASDAVGWSSNVPGMGFVLESSLTPESLRLMKKNGHSVLPQSVSALLQKQMCGKIDDRVSVYLMSSTQTAHNSDGGRKNYARDDAPITPLRTWRYLNVNLRSLILAVLGFIPAYYFFGIEYAILWFAITGFRNAIVDLIASVGLVPRGWNLKAIDRENMCASLFFSGLSVPILIGAKEGFDFMWQSLGGDEGFAFTFIKFWVIAFANGLYLVSHNTLRGFDKSAVRGNFFRSVLSWPLATAGSYVLSPLGVPDVVQAKIASEVVAGFIEGSVKTIKQNRLAQKAVIDVCRQINASNPIDAVIARLDMLFLWARYAQGRRAMSRLFRFSSRAFKKLSPEEQDTVRRARTAVCDAFMTEGSLESLTYAILKYYPEENLPILVDFVGQSHDAFKTWISAESCEQ